VLFPKSYCLAGRKNLMPRYAGVAHVQWELPFPLRLPEAAFLCWEPDEGTATFVPAYGVGTFAWSRTSPLLRIEDVFGVPGRGMVAIPTHDYRIASVLASGREILTAELTRGPNGGFTEPRPYAVANVFLCLRLADDQWASNTIQRATAVLNNVLDIYRLITLDPLARGINGQRDTYYTLVSLARTPPDWPEGSARDTLLRLEELRFGTTIGRDRIHQVGANSYDDLFFGGLLPTDHRDLFARIVDARHEIEVFHVLVFDAIRRLKRFEWALAVMDAQSAFEVLVATVFGEILTRQGVNALDIEGLLAHGGRFDSLQRRLVEIDRVAVAEATAAGEPARRFLGSSTESSWRADLYRLRHRIVHEGLRDVTFDLAKRAVIAGLKAAHAVQDLRPAFNRRLMWSGSALDLPHMTQSAGRLSRLFEA